MDNIIFEKIWEDINVAEYSIICTTELISIKQNIYIQDNKMEQIANTINLFLDFPEKNQYIQIGSKTGNYTSAFSMEFLSQDNRGHFLIEIDMEIEDNHQRKHRALFYLKTEFGLLEKFAKSLMPLAKDSIGSRIKLVEI